MKSKSRIRLIVFATIGVLLGFYLAGSFDSWTNFILSIIGASVSIAITLQTMEIYRKPVCTHTEVPERVDRYILCTCFLFTICWITSQIISASVEPGDEIGERRVAQVYIPAKSLQEEKDIYLKMFLALLTPCLIGVRLELDDIDREINLERREKSQS